MFASRDFIFLNIVLVFIGLKLELLHLFTTE